MQINALRTMIQESRGEYCEVKLVRVYPCVYIYCLCAQHLQEKLRGVSLH